MTREREAGQTPEKFTEGFLNLLKTLTEMMKEGKIEALVATEELVAGDYYEDYQWEVIEAGLSPERLETLANTLVFLMGLDLLRETGCHQSLEPHLRRVTMHFGSAIEGGMFGYPEEAIAADPYKAENDFIFLDENLVRLLEKNEALLKQGSSQGWQTLGAGMPLLEELKRQV